MEILFNFKKWMEECKITPNPKNPATRLNRKKTPCLIAVEVSPVRGYKYLVTTGAGVLVPRPLMRLYILLEDSEGGLRGSLHPKATEFTFENLNSNQVTGATDAAVAKATAAVARAAAAAVAWSTAAVVVLGLHVGQHLGLRHKPLVTQRAGVAMVAALVVPEADPGKGHVAQLTHLLVS
jgi:hypothetical protein